ncbi:hypothetical protein FGO68_gene17679 [Halteria grandinella]|uniref:Uncharacterized protein n=1 Tax=Halteria grandinella TaxID=5974 RepID=A0A8J8NBZ5_HALGN|nr:hypothetical protein FGO68_gene17679 [Halteria grandinella]
MPSWIFIRLRQSENSSQSSTSPMFFKQSKQPTFLLNAFSLGVSLSNLIVSPFAKLSATFSSQQDQISCLSSVSASIFAPREFCSH